MPLEKSRIPGKMNSAILSTLLFGVLVAALPVQEESGRQHEHGNKVPTHSISK